MRRTALAALAVVLALAAAGCIPEAPPPPAPVAATEIIRGLPVTVHEYVFTDTTRGIPAFDDYPGSPDRPIPVTVWYPSDRSHGPYPLLMFAHGFGVDPSFYSELLSRIASAGYVVAAPTYPILSGWPAGPSDQVGWNDLFDDTHFATSAVLFASAIGDPYIGGLVDGDRIAVAGHSDGALVAFGDGFEAWRTDARVRAVISYAALLREPGTMYQPNGRAFLHFASDQDEYNDFGTTVEWDHENLGQPSWTVGLWSAAHAPPYTDPADPHFDVVVRTSVDFLDAELKGGSSIWFALDVMFAADLAAFV